jgi:protein TonB
MKCCVVAITICLAFVCIPGMAPAQGQDATPGQSTLTPSEQKAQQQAAELIKEVKETQGKFPPKYPFKKFISARTEEPIYATYMREWIGRIEHTGNLNYPEQARKQGIHGDVILTVGINRDGTVHSIDVTRSSGHAVLDNAAEAIVKLCAPFPPLPADSKEKVDILYITRTWQFQPGDTSKPAT